MAQEVREDHDQDGHCSVSASQISLLLQEDEQVGENYETYQGEQKRRILFSFRSIVCHATLIMIYTCLWLAFIQSNKTPICASASPAEKDIDVKSPAQPGLLWEERRFPTNIVHNPFSGAPRKEMDEAWHLLLLNDNIIVPRKYLDEKNLTTIYTEDGRYGIASLSVYHSLHCLKKVQRMLFKEHYHQGKSIDAMAREVKHVEHCVEYIRETLMCQPDLSLVTFRWINNTAQHEDKSAFWPTNFDVDLHRCANWDALSNWAGNRVFDLFAVDKLQRPAPFSAF